MKKLVEGVIVREPVEGLGNISAKVIADSVCKNTGVRLITMELEYPRFIHSELMTHRMFSRNAASSRAIPVERMIENIKARTGMPIHWGKNQAGMSAKEVHNDGVLVDETLTMNKEDAWAVARDRGIDMAHAFHKAGYHKQIVNRLTEPYQMMKTVVSATEWANFFELRLHPDAQPEFQELARVMKLAQDASVPVVLEAGQWHVPYFDQGYFAIDYYGQGDWFHTDATGHIWQLGEALAISASCCAQVSYRRLDDSLEKAQMIYDKLITSKPEHASPIEHQATPMYRDHESLKSSLPTGFTHLSYLEGVAQYWSGNFRQWAQHRHYR